MSEQSHRRNLPHLIDNSRPYFVTARLEGSIPNAALEKLRIDLEHDLRQIPKGQEDTEISRANTHKRFFGKFDELLDADEEGPHWLEREDVCEIVQEELHRLETEGEYWLWSYTIMSNHIHLLFTLAAEKTSLSDVLKILKVRTAFRCNRVMERSGSFWQHESYDHIVRDGEFGRIATYILNNPVKAKFAKTAEEWRWNYLAPDVDKEALV